MNPNALNIKVSQSMLELQYIAAGPKRPQLARQTLQVTCDNNNKAPMLPAATLSQLGNNRERQVAAVAAYHDFACMYPKSVWK